MINYNFKIKFFVFIKINVKATLYVCINKVNEFKKQ